MEKRHRPEPGDAQGHRAYKQFGNSVVVPLMTEVAKQVVRKLEKLDQKSPEQSERKVVTSDE